MSNKQSFAIVTSVNVALLGGISQESQGFLTVRKEGVNKFSVINKSSGQVTFCTFLFAKLLVA